jgi:hypothetical protein
VLRYPLSLDNGLPKKLAVLDPRVTNVAVSDVGLSLCLLSKIDLKQDLRCTDSLSRS